MYLEHANLTVPDIEAATRFLQTAFPEFRIRGGGDRTAGRWQHVGTDVTYLALQQQTEHRADPRTPYVHDGVHHLGFVVDDVESLAQRLTQAGYRENELSEQHPARIRRYFFDNAGMEWEFVQYLSDDPAQRNAY
ncbi:VOC family protein [Saccharospirillum mangrovi]|uniref:VOC family protein n=1 Tax=Saccharospirillum mangrovi TaxID=2161747 RepID=UPI000D340DAD|nr:VOC family protein [Saccharospirillum mangrovi]